MVAAATAVPPRQTLLNILQTLGLDSEIAGRTEGIFPRKALRFRTLKPIAGGQMTLTPRVIRSTQSPMSQSTMQTSYTA